MKTYQELVALGENESERRAFVRAAVQEHKQTKAYKTAADAEEYYAKNNVTITRHVKMLRDITGEAVPDYFGADWRLKSLAFRRLVIQQVQFVLSNGISFAKDDTKERMGKNFDREIVNIVTKAMVDGVGFGFWNFDHLETFCFADTDIAPGFVPIMDEDNGLMCAGVRYWKINDGKTERFTLYEPDGKTEYIKREKDTEPQLLDDVKRPYITVRKQNEAQGVVEEVGVNWPSLPIIPMWANDLRQSELVGIRDTIDCIDFIKSGLANDIDEASGFYWTLEGTAGMDEMDLRQFIERMHVVKAAVLEDGTKANAHTLDIPYEARDSILNRLEGDLYRDFQMLNVSELSATAKTATEIRAAYQPMEDKCGAFEYCIRDFIQRLLDMLGIDDEPSFTWNRIANMTEETQMVLMAAQHLDDETILRKLPWLTPEEVDEILARKDAEDVYRQTGFNTLNSKQNPENNPQEPQQEDQGGQE